MNEEDCTKQIYEWAIRYCKQVNNFAKFKGFRYLGEVTIGLTTIYQNKGTTKIEIEITTTLDKDWQIKAVLWHEFCHAWAYCDLGDYHSHGWEWVKRFWKKPIMAVLDLLMKI